MESFIRRSVGRFQAALESELAAWPKYVDVSADPWWPGIRRVPALADSLCSLLEDKDVQASERRIVRRVLKYLLSPLDLVPEYIYGVTGLREDFYLVALAVDRWRERLGADLLAKNGLDPDDPDLKAARAAGEADLDEDVRSHLALVLEADYVAGDEADSLQPPPPAAPEGDRFVITFAGPGTGKTRRIEDELLRLLLDQGAEPGSIMITTFTNKAADELRVRVRARIIESGRFPRPDQVVQLLTISTIHAFCHALISEFHHHLLFLKGTFSPIDDAQRILFLFRRGIGKLRLKPVYADWKKEQRESEGWTPTDLFHFYSRVGEIYDFLSEEVVTGHRPDLRQRYLQIIHGAPSSVTERIIATYPRYWKALQQAGYLDHSMVLSYVEALLDDPHVLLRVQHRFRHLLVDEYQDTNPIQDRIFSKIAGSTGRLFVVADDDQSIYAFRGADVKNATDFKKRHQPARTKTLNENFRSTAALLASTQQLISKNATRHPKELHTGNPKGDPPWRLEAPFKKLPERLAGLLSDLMKEGSIEKWSDAALLFRGMTRRVAEYRKALEEREIPCCSSGDKRFLKKPFVKSLVGILGFIHKDPSKITTRIRKHHPFFEALDYPDKEKRLDLLKQWNSSLHDEEYSSILDLFYSILSDTNAIAFPDLLPDLGAFSNIIAEAEEELKSPDIKKRLGFFLQFLEAAASGLEGPGDPGEDGVQVMTIHKSKGLEFPVVIIADATAEYLPADFPPDAWTCLRQDLGCADPGPDALDEERRVLYVGLTRAERIAVLATTKENPSRFIAEMKTVKAPPGAKHITHRRPEIPRTPPLHAPHGHLFNYNYCPKRYLLENRYSFAGRAIAPLRAGTSLHRALEILHRLMRDGETITADRRKRILERAWVAPSAKKKAQKEFEELLDVFERYAASVEKEGRPKVVEVERPFYVAEKDGVLTGTIDLVRERNGNLEIVEFKFSKNPLLQDYARQQLDHYSLSMPDEKPRLVVHYLKKDEETSFPTRPPQETRGMLAETFGKIRRGEFNARPEKKGCGICPVRFACSEKVG